MLGSKVNLCINSQLLVFLPPDIASSECNVGEGGKRHHEVQICMFSKPFVLILIHTVNLHRGSAGPRSV